MLSIDRESKKLPFGLHTIIKLSYRPFISPPNHKIVLLPCILLDDGDDAGDTEKETQNFGLVLQTMDPASAAGNTLQVHFLFGKCGCWCRCLCGSKYGFIS